MRDDLTGRGVLVTGATGFIGGRLAQRLDAAGATVRGTGRKAREDVPALQDTNVELVRADLRDRDAMAAAVDGCEVVFAVAAWLGGDRPVPEPARDINIDAAVQLVEVCADAGVKRVVHVSTIAAYGPPPDGPVPEEHPLDPSDANDEYGRTKAEGEVKVFEAAAARDLPVAVVRPGMVYGPGSWTWTAKIASLVAKGVPTIFGDGAGCGSPIFVDDLCDLLTICATHDGAVGEAFNAVDRPVPWSEFFGAYGDMVGRKPKRIPMWAASTIAFANEILPLGLPLNRTRLRHYRAKPDYLRVKAQERLGWAPCVSFADGMEASAGWLKEIGRL